MSIAFLRRRRQARPLRLLACAAAGAGALVLAACDRTADAPPPVKSAPPSVDGVRANDAAAPLPPTAAPSGPGEGHTAIGGAPPASSPGGAAAAGSAAAPTGGDGQQPPPRSDEDRARAPAKP